MAARGQAGPSIGPRRPRKASFDQQLVANKLGPNGRIRHERGYVSRTSDSGFAAFRDARVLITGGVGLIGSALARRLVALGAAVVPVDSMVPEAGGNFGNIADIRDLAPVHIADIRHPGALPPLLAHQGSL